MYATHDGNVYKNTGNGWSSYDNGNWNSVNSSKNAQASRTTKNPVAVVPIRPQPSSAHRVLNARASRRKVGVPDLARWTGRPRTGNAAHRKASASVIPNGSAVGANALEVGANGLEVAANALAVAGVDDERSQLG